MTSFIIYYVEGVVDFTDWAMVKLQKTSFYPNFPAISLKQKLRSFKERSFEF